MPESPNPNQWVVISDFCKTVVTIAGVLLGLTGTFATAMLGDLNLLSKFLLVSSWLFMILAIGFALISQAKLVEVLRPVEDEGQPREANQDDAQASSKLNENRTIFFANASFISLGVASIVFGLSSMLAIGKVGSIKSTVAVQTAISNAAELYPSVKSGWTLKGLDWNQEDQSYAITLIGGEATSVEMTIDSDGRVSQSKTN